MSAPILQRISNNDFTEGDNGSTKLIAVGDFFVRMVVPSNTNSRLNLRVYTVNSSDELEVVSDTEINENGGLGGYYSNGYDLAYDPKLDALIAIYSWFNGPSTYSQGNVCVIDNAGQVTVKSPVLFSINTLYSIINLVYDSVKDQFVMVLKSSTGAYIKGVTINDVPTGSISFLSANSVGGSTVSEIDIIYSTVDDMPILLLRDSSRSTYLEMATLYNDGLRYQTNAFSSISDVNVTPGDTLIYYTIFYDETSNSTLLVFKNNTTGVDGLCVVLTISGSLIVVGLSSVLSIPNIQSYSYINKGLCVIPDADVLYLTHYSTDDVFYDNFIKIDGNTVTVTSITNDEDSGNAPSYIGAWNKIIERLISIGRYDTYGTPHILSRLYPTPFWRNNRGHSEKISGEPIEV